MYKVIVSFTTSPSRLLRVKPVIESILNQDYEVYGIEINLPKKYKNTEEYILPDFLELEENSNICKYYPKVKIFRIENDLGPGTKIIPTILRYIDNPDSNLYLVSIDDDNRYPEKLVSSLLKGMKLYGENHIYCIGGYNLRLASKCRVELDEITEGKVSVIEGIYGVLYNPRLFTEEIGAYFYKILENKQCFTSDDITISNYLSFKEINIIKLCFKKFNKVLFWKELMFKNGKIAASKNDKNAIHKMKGGHKKRYFDACIWLKENKMLFLPIKLTQ
jgi:hypothetical protein